MMDKYDNYIDKKLSASNNHLVLLSEKESRKIL